MFEKISNAAEKLATNVSESRRSFLVRVGQAALGVTGVVAGLLALPSEAQALGLKNACVQSNDTLTGFCIDNRRGTCDLCESSRCPAGTRGQPGSFFVCRIHVDPARGCTCF